MSRDHHKLGSDKFNFKGRRAILQKHLDHFAQIQMQFIERFTLGVRTGKAGYISNQHASVRIAFDDRSE